MPCLTHQVNFWPLTPRFSCFWQTSSTTFKLHVLRMSSLIWSSSLSTGRRGWSMPASPRHREAWSRRTDRAQHWDRKRRREVDWIRRVCADSTTGENDVRCNSKTPPDSRRCIVRKTKQKHFEMFAHFYCSVVHMIMSKHLQRCFKTFQAGIYWAQHENRPWWSQEPTLPSIGLNLLCPIAGEK